MSVPDVSDCALGARPLKGRVAVVTGGARNIGLAIARRLNEAGARVVIADRDGEEGATAISYLHSIGLAAEFVATDVTESSEVSAVADLVVNRHGTLDVWVNCAGKFPYRPALEITDDDWDDMIAVNLRGTFLGSREAARRMVRAGRRGVIVNISSCAAFRTGGPELAHYVASKFGVRGSRRRCRRIRCIRHSVIGVAPTYIERRPAVRCTSPTRRRAKVSAQLTFAGAGRVWLSRRRRPGAVPPPATPRC
jgi:NAD(P)-dependent dehydrogenase (short-subunit alcohol dehydrogenase family)